MKIARFQRSGQIVLVAEVGDRFFDVSFAPNGFSDIRVLLSHSDPSAALKVVLNEAAELDTLDNLQVAPPLDVQEVWASGVTYFRSKVARIGESVEGRAFYDKVYAAERPELFFKSAPSRVVGHQQPVRIRRDSTWNVPEPELALVLSSSGRIVGYTIGNDMSSRSIEGENPLYIPQAKVYDGSCALGPWILVANETNIPDGISMTVRRFASRRPFAAGADPPRFDLERSGTGIGAGVVVIGTDRWLHDRERYVVAVARGREPAIYSASKGV